MSLRAWRAVYASVAGTSHARTGTPCQDAGCCQVVLDKDGRDILIASVSDGAGSASHSGHGARLAVTSFQRAFADLAGAQPDLGFLDQDRARLWLAELQADIARVAAENGLLPRDYACTFLGAVVGPAAAVFMQVGDGAIVAADGDAAGRHAWVFWPQHGEFANSTFFVTMDEADQMMEFARRDAPHDAPVLELAMFSDGLERMILDMRSRTVHSPSLSPVFAWLAMTEPDANGAASSVLASYLTSERVNRRTDDDKTLVMATRAMPPETAG